MAVWGRSGGGHGGWWRASSVVVWLVAGVVVRVGGGVRRRVGRRCVSWVQVLLSCGSVRPVGSGWAWGCARTRCIARRRAGLGIGGGLTWLTIAGSN